MVDMRKVLYDKMQKKIVNEDILDPELRDIKGVVIETLRELPDFEMIGYSNESLTPKEKFRIEFKDLLIKRNHTKPSVNWWEEEGNAIEPWSVDLSRTKLDLLRCYFIIDPALISDSKKEEALIDTKYRIAELKSEMEVLYDGELLQYIEDIDGTKDMGRENEYDMILEVPILIPRLVNGQYFMLGGRKYYSAFYLRKVGIWRGSGDEGVDKKLEVTNIMKRPHHGSDELSSYIWVGSDDVIRYQFLGKTVNPFAFFNNTNNLYIHEVFPEFFQKKKVPKGELGEILMKTFNIWKNKERDEYLSDKEEAINSKELKDYKYKLIDDTDEDEIVNAIYNVLIPDDREMVFDIHKSMRKYLKIEILKRIPNFRNKNRAQPDKVKERVNIHPMTVVTIVKKYKQYSSTVWDSANVIDAYHRFMYISELGKGKRVSDERRRYRKEHMGVIDPIASSTSDNLGLSGMLCLSIDSKYLLGWDNHVN